MKNKLTEKLTREEISAESSRIFGEYPIKSVWLIGSYAQGKEKNESDIDFLVELDDDYHHKSRLRQIWEDEEVVDDHKESKDTFDLFDLAELKQKLETRLGKRVDLANLRNLKKRYKPFIFKQRVKIYDKKD
jgi:predicted nucleotidyltransferase